MKNHDRYDSRLCRQQRQFYRDRNLDVSYFEQQDREFRGHHLERQYQPNVLRDVDPEAEWAEYCDERWLP